MDAADEACVLNMSTGPEIARRQLHGGSELTEGPSPAPLVKVKSAPGSLRENCPRLAVVSPAWLSAARGEPRRASPAPSGRLRCRYTACRSPGRSPLAIASSLASKALVRPFSASPVTCTGTLRGRAGVDRHGPGPDR